MTSPAKQQERIAILALFAIGMLMLVIAVFVDPVGASPRSGVLDLGTTGTRWAFGCVGLVLLACGAWFLVKARRGGSE